MTVHEEGENMGFKFKKVIFTAGDSNFPTGNSDVLRRTRSENIISACAQAIIDCNCGWELDTDKNQTITSYTDIPTRIGDKNYPGLFLVNTESKCKLFMAHFGDEVSSCGIKDFSGNDVYMFHGPNYKYVGGLCMSMIPDGSNSTFGDPTTTTFIPSDATRIAGTAWRYTTYYADSYNPTSGTKYVYGLFVSPYVIVTSATHRGTSESWSLANPIYGIGRIFGALAHEEDNAVNSKYGFVYFRSEPDTNSIGEGFYPDIRWQTTYILESYQLTWIVGCDPRANPVSVNGCISAADGSWLNGTDWSSRNVPMYVESYSQLANTVHKNNSTSKRWVPLAMSAVARDLDSFCVIDGDGFKGYLDTDIFRCSISTSDQLYDNGKFICAGDQSNLLLGWDPSNESRIF